MRDAATVSQVLLATTLLLATVSGAQQPVGPADAVMEAPEVRLLEASPGRTVVQLAFPVGRAPASWREAGRIEWTDAHDRRFGPDGTEIPAPPEYVRTVAVPSRTTPALRIAAVDWLREPSDPSASPVEVSAPTIYRGVPLAGVTVRPEAGGGVLAAVVFELLHDGAVGKANADAPSVRRAGREPLPGGVLNPDLFRRLRAASVERPAPLRKAATSRGSYLDAFARTDHWVRLEVEETALYRLSGNDLAALGLSLEAISPGKVRLFKGGGLLHDDNPEAEPDDVDMRTGLTEVPVDLRGMDDNEWNADDSLVFYGFGTMVWADRLDPEAGRLEHFDHPHQARGVYWLTWEDELTESPFAEAPRRVGDPVAAPPTGAGDPVTTHRARYHGEENLAPVSGELEDDWAWDGAITGGFEKTFHLDGVVPGEPAVFEVQVVARYSVSSNGSGPTRAEAYLNGDTANAVEHEWSIFEQDDPPGGIRFGGSTDVLERGDNTISLTYQNYQDAGRLLGFDRFQLDYLASLDKNEYRAELTGVFWGDEVTEPGTVRDVRFGLPSDVDVALWDVTDPAAVFALGGEITGGAERVLTVGLAQEPGQTRHLVLFDDGDLRAVATAALADPIPLREELQPADYLVIHPPLFSQPAAELAALRSRTLPGIDDPRAIAVDVEDIYANFAGGQKDWRAIQRFLRWYFYTHGQRLRWVCLLGDASIDYRNQFGTQPGLGIYDFIPTELVSPWPSYFAWVSISAPYTTDDTLVALDAPPFDRPQLDTPDIAVGRIPAATLAQAEAMVARAVMYAEDPPSGAWRNNVLMSADDLHRPSGGSPSWREEDHILQSERLVTYRIPTSVDVDKVYMVDYPLIGLYKPDARRDLLGALNEGTTLFYYVGHGAAVTLADEQLFQITDIAGLNNGDRRFVFMAFSCDVGVYADPSSQCMAEDFLTATQGGGIASVAASWVSLSSANDAFSGELFGAYFPDRHVSAGATLGEAMIAGKVAMWPSNFWVPNARRYVMLGDPATRLPHAVDDLRLADTSSDSLLTGRLHQLDIDLAQFDIAYGANTTYELLVQESPVVREFVAFDDSVHTYRAVPQPVFRGTGVLDAPDTAIPFLAPQSMRTGDDGRFRLIVEDGTGPARAAVLEVPVVQVESSAGGDVDGPAIDLAFEGGGNRVQPGTPLVASLSDTNGINILATNPANSVLLEFDRSGIYNNVSGDVVFEPGSYSRARLETTLPADLELGEHTVVMTASDMFGNVGADTLSFDLEAQGVAGMRNATVFPNPTAGPCRLVCDLSGPMTVQWDIYTVSGRRIRQLEDTFTSAGPAILEWDGRDGEGDSIANGVYLYVLRGRLPGDDHELRETGQVVIMR